MKTEYHKLVRDRVPDIIRNGGYVCDITQMNEEEFQQALCEKLIEEACEVATANHHELITELADLYEVINAIMDSYGVTLDAVRTEQERLRAERGGFEHRIRLHSMSLADANN